MYKSLGYSAVLSVAAAGGTAHAGIISGDLNDNLVSGVPLIYDFNSDLVDDVRFLHTYGSGGGSYSYSAHGDLWAYGLNGTLISISGPIADGALIDSSTSFATSNHLADYNYRWWSGSCGRWGCSSGGSSTDILGTWNDGYNSVTGFLGFALDDGNGVNYGWINLTMHRYGNGTVNSFALETRNGRGIVAGNRGAQSSGIGKPDGTVPEPGMAGLLALGSAGVVALRRRKRLSA